MCFPSSPMTVTYRAELHGTGYTTAEDLIPVIEKWIQEGASITIRFRLLTVDSSCDVHITSYMERECRAVDSSKQSSHLREVIGCVVGVNIILIVLILILAVIVAVRRYRHTRSTTRRMVRTIRYVQTVPLC